MRKPSRQAQPTAVLYARVSTKEQSEEGFSIDAQLSLLRDYARRQGFVCLAEFVDSESGSKSGRTEFGKMLALIAEKNIGAIVVEKTDRLYRNWADYVRLDETNVDLHFAKEGTVIGPESRSSDKFMHEIKVALARHFSGNLKEEVRKGMNQKAKDGIFPSVAPLGYRNVKLGPKKTIALDPDRAPIIRDLFETYAAGSHSILTLTHLARENGLRARKGGILAPAAIGRLLDNPIYCGIVRWNGMDYAGVHEQIVPLALFNKVQDIMHGRKTNAGYGERDFAFKGLMVCGYCGCNITAEIKKEKYVYYRCTGMRDRSCPGLKVVPESKLSSQFAGLLECLELNEEQIGWLKDGLRESLQETKALTDDQRRRLQRDEKRIKGTMERMYLDKLNAETPTDPELYDGIMKRLQRELAETQINIQALSNAEVDYLDMGARILELAKTASKRFEAADFRTKREIILELTQNRVLRGEKLEYQLQEPYASMARNKAENAPKIIWYTAGVALATQLAA